MMAALLVISLAGCSNQPQAETEETQSGAKVQEESAESVKTEAIATAAAANKPAIVFGHFLLSVFSILYLRIEKRS